MLHVCSECENLVLSGAFLLFFCLFVVFFNFAEVLYNFDKTLTNM